MSEAYKHMKDPKLSNWIDWINPTAVKGGRMRPRKTQFL